MKSVKIVLRRDFGFPAANCLISRFTSHFISRVVDENYIPQSQDILFERTVNESEKALFVLLKPASYPLPWCPDCPYEVDCDANYRFDLANGDLLTESEFREKYPDNWNTDYCLKIDLD